MTFTRIVFALFLWVVICNSNAQTPKSIKTNELLIKGNSGVELREKESINESWKQFTGDVVGAEKVDFNDESWQTVNLPHTWNAIDAYTQKNIIEV